MPPFRLNMYMVVAADSLEDAAAARDAIEESLPHGVFCETSSVMKMDPADVVEGSPLDTALR